MRARIGILASLVLASALGAAAAGPASSASPAAPTRQTVSLLYAVSGASATMTLLPGSGNRYAFTLRGADARTVWFSDRPARDSGTLPTSGLVGQWAGIGFAADPPNVAIALHDPVGATDTIVAVMRRPSLRGGVLRATMQVLTSEQAGAVTGNLAAHGDRHDANGIPARLGPVSVFIDDASVVIINECVIQPYTSCEGANLSGAPLASANLTGANMKNANLAGANLSGANVAGANLGGADFGGANLAGANLGGANLLEAFLGAADLAGASLRFADLEWANLQGADLTGADMSGADLSAATWIDGTQCAGGSTGGCDPVILPNP